MYTQRDSGQMTLEEESYVSYREMLAQKQSSELGMSTSGLGIKRTDLSQQWTVWTVFFFLL